MMELRTLSASDIGIDPSAFDAPARVEPGVKTRRCNVRDRFSFFLSSLIISDDFSGGVGVGVGGDRIREWRSAAQPDQ